MATEPLLTEILRVRLSNKSYKLLSLSARGDDRDTSTLARRIIEDWLELNTTPSERREADKLKR